VSVDIRSIDPQDPDPKLIAACAEAILRGGCVSFLTDTFYGLGCSLMDGDSVEMVYHFKKRPEQRAVISLISEPREVEALALHIPEVAEQLMKDYWPGPLSIIFRASPLVPKGSRGPGETIALRCPDHRLSMDLMKAVGGPVVATSANFSGEPPAKTAQDVEKTFGNQLAMILDSGPATATQPSTLVSVTSGRAELVREGSLDVRGFLKA